MFIFKRLLKIKMENVKFNFEGKTVVITGASRGIGLAIANAFLESGASVINISKSNSEVNLEKPNYIFLQEDISNLPSIEKWINEFYNRGKKIDFWINNAGIYFGSPLINVSEEHWDEIFSVNLKSLFSFLNLLHNT